MADSLVVILGLSSVAAFGSLIFFERLSGGLRADFYPAHPTGYNQESSYVLRRFGSISDDTSLETGRRALINESWNFDSSYVAGGSASKCVRQTDD